MLNMDFSVPVLIDLQLESWLPSPMPGVERKPLARESAERGHATSVVKYAPGSVFRPHPHPLGEEILVLAGVFSDENGDYPAGTYFRNPPGSSHAPFSEQGCVLFVKLHQFLPSDQEHVMVSPLTSKMPFGQPVWLHRYESEGVFIMRLKAGFVEPLKVHVSNMVEMLILEGDVEYSGKCLPALSWLRIPVIDWLSFQVKSDVTLWVKTGHF